MSADLGVIGAQLKLWISFSFLALCMQPPLCCLHQQITHLFFPTLSMRLRSKRTCSGVDYFGGFHIIRFFYLFLFLRRPHFKLSNLD
ncbi:hypothetical protein Vadar_028091 [Vaccinium darrowii]|uniref:Uncharacterized protein n=1 Tax=Vaccinium darrowii TaxID=229202 RepID=A0ACB7XKI7_9ERIC|nr:hypothetical protein Vadar_028091 [Vaccinium darrowii]